MNYFNDHLWSQHDGTEAEPSSPVTRPRQTLILPGRRYFDDQCDKKIEQDALVLRVIDCPELYEQIQAKVKYKSPGWCKSATTAGNVSIIPCDCHRYS